MGFNIIKWDVRKIFKGSSGDFNGIYLMEFSGIWLGFKWFDGDLMGFLGILYNGILWILSDLLLIWWDCLGMESAYLWDMETTRATS